MTFGRNGAFYYVVYQIDDDVSILIDFVEKMGKAGAELLLEISNQLIRPSNEVSQDYDVSWRSLLVHETECVAPEACDDNIEAQVDHVQVIDLISDITTSGS